MKIIKKGKTPLKDICKNCNCEFEYDEKDLQYQFSSITQNYITCPWCKNKIWNVRSELDE